MQIRGTPKGGMTDSGSVSTSEGTAAQRRKKNLRPIDLGFRRLAVVLGVFVGLLFSVFAFIATMDAVYPAARSRAKTRIAAELDVPPDEVPSFDDLRAAGRQNNPFLRLGDKDEDANIAKGERWGALLAALKRRQVEERLEREELRLNVEASCWAVPAGLFAGALTFGATWLLFRAIGWIVCGFVYGD